jgi:transposase InsO family protein
VNRRNGYDEIDSTFAAGRDECRIIFNYPTFETLLEFAEELDLYFIWYNEHRPHEWLDGRTPMEAYRQADRRTDQWRRVSTTEPMALELAFLEGRRHLPIVGLKKVG